MTAHSQVTHTAKKDDSSHACFINRRAQQRAHHRIGSTRFIDHGGTKRVVLISESLEPFFERTTA
jgi:hypothetical protein